MGSKAWQAANRTRTRGGTQLNRDIERFMEWKVKPKVAGNPKAGGGYPKTVNDKTILRVFSGATSLDDISGVVAPIIRRALAALGQAGPSDALIDGTATDGARRPA